MKSDHRKRVNLKDVAKEAQTSVATVSRVLNDSGYCSDEIRIRVQKAVEKLGYQPNLHANFAEVAVDLLLNYIQNPAELDNRPYPSKSALNYYYAVPPVPLAVCDNSFQILRYDCGLPDY